jgi:hypothetical protein
MTNLELLMTLVAFPFAVLLGAWLGRKVMRRMWELHLPYEDRLANVRRDRR